MSNGDERLAQALGCGTVLDTIYTRFAELRAEGKADAYRWLHEALSRNAQVLVPAVIPLKDFNGLLMELETFLKGSMSEHGETPGESLMRWLNEPEPVTEVVQ